ncbi:MAG: serine protease [Hellea sp.]
MISQLQNNFRILGTALILSSAALSIPMTAMAENVTAEFVTTDWLIFAKLENSVLTELSRHSQGPAMIAAANTALNLNASADNFDQNYLYILVGNRRGDGMEPYLAGRLTGSKSVLTGDGNMTVMDSNFKDINPPANLNMIEEIIERGFGGGPFGATAPTRVGGSSKPVNGENIAAAWSAGQNENGAVNVFRIPYSAMLNPPSEDSAADTVPNGGSGGASVTIDVGGLLGSLFGKKDKKSDIPEEDAPPADVLVPEDTIVPEDTGDSASDMDEIIENNDPIVITPPPEIITQYVADPDVLADRDRLLEERTGMLDYIKGLTNVIKEREATIRDLRGDLTRAQNGVDRVPALLTPLHTQIATQKRELLADKNALADKEKEVAALNQRIAELEGRPSPIAIPTLIAGGLGLSGLGGLIGVMLGRRKRRRPQNAATPLETRPLIPVFLKNLKSPKNSSSFDTLKKGMCFSASPMLLGGLPMSLAIIKPVYDAVGRIGFAQDGKPVGKDESFGTGILVSDRHILTNRHVWEMFKNRLAGDEGTGIEFYGEKKSDKSEFIAFDGAEPVCIDGWDAAIFTLSRTPENRPPVSIASRPAEELNDLDIVVVGYPQARRVTEDIAEVTEKDPVFGVKRYSEGKIFRHSVDVENPYGVEADVEQIINPSETLRAICHNASTLGGSSGSAVICKKTGDLIALHFGFDSAYEWKEAANFALAGENLAQSVAEITASVTPVTDKPINET